MTKRIAVAAGATFVVGVLLVLLLTMLLSTSATDESVQSVPSPSGSNASPSGSPSPALVSNSPTPSAAGGAAASSAEPSDGSSSSRVKPRPTLGSSATAVADLPVDETLVSDVIVVDTVCGMRKETILGYAGGFDGASVDTEMLRDGVVTLSDQIQTWRQVAGTDDRIELALWYAEETEVLWRKAQVALDKLNESRADRLLMRAERRLTALDATGVSELCPTESDAP